jgi:aminoglycoside phosphotransferase (APT) family kinase protein
VSSAPDEQASGRPDEAALTGWADAHLAGDGPCRVEPLGEGHSNLTFALTRAGAPPYVLRRPPAGPLLPTAHDVVRESRFLALLQGSPVPVPTVAAVCEDAQVIGAPFYVMERVPGEVIRHDMPDWLTPKARHALGLDLVDTLAAVHRLEPGPFLQAGLGRSEGYLDRQLARWISQRTAVEQAVAAAGGHARALPDYDAVRDWLLAHRPDPVDAVVVHGDFKLDNVIVDPQTSTVAAVVDWEMASVGDPRADVGYLLSFWPEPGEPAALSGMSPTAAGGFPTRLELVERWSAQVAREVDDLSWFVALAIWKLAILLEASYHRWLAGMSDDAFFGTLDEGVPALLRRAREVSGA